MAKRKEKKPAIILNHMFTGNYLDNNIGHEIINLFADDDGRNFIYLCKEGKFNRDDIDVNNSYVIQVRRPKNQTGMLEVVSIAKGLNQVIESSYPHTESEGDKALFDKCCPKYGGKSIYDIFKFNRLQQDCCVTFEAAEIFLPNQSVFISHDGSQKDCCEAVINKNPSQQMREYILQGDPDFENLMKIIPQGASTYAEALWSLRNPDESKVGVGDVYITATDIYGIQGRELSYSNAFKYFIDEYPELFHEFCEIRNYDKLEPGIVPNVLREWNNIDLLIEWGDTVFVVENKVFSGINGLQQDGKTQLDKYKNIVQQKKGDENPYYNKKHKFILLTPNHNEIKVSNTDWKVIKYSDVYSFLKSKIDIEPYKSDFHFVDFVKSLELHSKADYNRIVMHKKFLKAIKATKKTK